MASTSKIYQCVKRRGAFPACNSFEKDRPTLKWWYAILNATMNAFLTVLFLCGIVSFALLPAGDLWADSIYTWTDRSGIVHITETPPPSGVAVDTVMINPPSSSPFFPQKGQAQSRSVWNWNVRQAEVEARQAQQQLQTAAKNAQQAEIQAHETMQWSMHYIDTHDQNQYMRRVFKFQLKQAKNAVEDAEAKVRKAVDQLKQADQQDQATQEQLREAQEDAEIFTKL